MGRADLRVPIVFKSGRLSFLEPSSGIAVSLPLRRRFLSISAGYLKGSHKVQRCETELSLK